MTSPTTFDAFLGYSRKDLDFAKALKQALERYTPPREMRAERRAVAICRDQDDRGRVAYVDQRGRGAEGDVSSFNSAHWLSTAGRTTMR